MFRALGSILVVGSVVSIVAGCTGTGSEHQSTESSESKRTVALVLNARSDFWKSAEAGVRQAQAELPDFNLIVKYPAESTPTSQIALVDDLAASGVSAIMISTIDPRAESDALKAVALKVPLVTTDSDVPDSNRVAFIGSSNEQAGVLAGQIVLKSVPDGGKCIGFVGRASALNAQQRVVGINGTLHGSNVELIDVMDDAADHNRARQNAASALQEHPDIKCMIGLYWYNAPSITQALKESGRDGTVKVIGFDDHPATLDGIEDGTIAGTVVQQPYAWGYQGMKDLAQYLNGDKSWVPADRMIYLPSLIVDRSNLATFRHQQAQY